MHSKPLAILSLGLIVVELCRPLGFAQDAASEPISDELMQAIENVALATLGFAETVRPAIDRAAFDQDSLLEGLDFDATEIIRFVTEDIAYEPYAGVLRGAHGTLLARAGNAIDQSLLLATLLNDAGFEAVIRGGALPVDDAVRLLRVLGDRPEPVPAVDEAVIETARREWLGGVASLLDIGTREDREPAITLDQVIEGIELDRDALLAALGEARVALGDRAAERRLLEETGEYFWVEYRDGPASAWIGAHPAFGGVEAPTPTVTVSYAGDIPTELTHRIRLELIVEQRLGDDIRSTALMDPIEFPSANVTGQSMWLTMLPDTLLRSGALVGDVSLETETRFLVPMIDHALPAGALALALDGTTVPPELIQLSQTGVFETVGDRFGNAASALRGLGADDDEPEALTAIDAVRLRLTLIHPAEPERAIERVLYQAPDRARSAGASEVARRAAIVSELASAHSLGFVTGALSAPYVLDRNLGELERNGPLIRAWTDPAIDSCASLDCLPQPELEPSPSGDSVALVVATFDELLPIDAESVIFRDAPNVVRSSRPLFPETSPTPGVFDIMANSRRAFRFEDRGPVASAELVLLAGVAETHLERIQPGSRAVGSTIERRLGDRNAAALRVWVDEPPALDAQAAIEAAMLADALSSGSVVVTAALAAEPSGAPFGWWEIDPDTGRTLGMARHGGPSLLEWAAALMVPAAYLGSFAHLCDSMPIRRLSPADGRVQSANFLSCLVCTSVYLMPNINDDTAYRDAVRSCIDRRGGWEYG